MTQIISKFMTYSNLVNNMPICISVVTCPDPCLANGIAICSNMDENNKLVEGSTVENICNAGYQ